MTTVDISIIVKRGSPLDYPQYRHTALWLRFEDGSPPLVVNIVGPSGDYQFESRESDQPWEEEGHAKLVDVGTLAGPATAAHVVNQLRSVPIRNSDPEFNCQTWVERALKKFNDDGQLSTESYEKGIDGMVDAIAEAEDVEE